MKANVWRTLIALAFDWGSIFTLATVSWVAFGRYGITVYTLTLYAVACLWIASRQRALECLIHEASHVNLCRNIKGNDALAWVLAALPLGHNLVTERRSHLIGHHKNFWDIEQDPDFRRYRQIGIDQLPAGSVKELLRILLRGYLPYVQSTIPAFFLPAGEKRVHRVGRLFFWMAVLILCTSIGGLLPLALYWFLPFLTILTCIRYIGEASEHAALGCTNEFGTTRNNLGWLNEYFIHPHGDAYHLIHHLYPKMPFYQMAHAHRLLLTDPTYRNAGLHCNAFLIKRDAKPSTVASLSQHRDSISIKGIQQ